MDKEEKVVVMKWKCRECGHIYTPKAGTLEYCPKCNAHMKFALVDYEGREERLIIRHKILKFISSLLMGPGAVFTLVGIVKLDTPQEFVFWGGVIAFVMGMVVYIVERFLRE